MLERTMNGLEEGLHFRMTESASGKSGLKSGLEYCKSVSFLSLLLSFSLSLFRALFQAFL